VLDEHNVGDIHGALGTLRQHVTKPRSRRHRLLALLAIMGPGLIVMVGDNDAGGVATYAQAGQNYRLTLLWTLVLLVPVLIVNQEMVVRLGAVTGVGHARLIIERFGKFWGAFSVGDLFILNFLTIVTEAGMGHNSTLGPSREGERRFRHVYGSYPRSRRPRNAESGDMTQSRRLASPPTWRRGSTPSPDRRR
jgi:Natural resistance-associated macrophage protein-like